MDFLGVFPTHKQNKNNKTDLDSCCYGPVGPIIIIPALTGKNVSYFSRLLWVFLFIVFFWGGGSGPLLVVFGGSDPPPPPACPGYGSDVRLLFTLLKYSSSSCHHRSMHICYWIEWKNAFYSRSLRNDTRSNIEIKTYIRHMSVD